MESEQVLRHLFFLKILSSVCLCKKYLYVAVTVVWTVIHMAPCCMLLCCYVLLIRVNLNLIELFGVMQVIIIKGTTLCG